MKKLTATFEIVTPMFLGDAEQKATSIRPPSVKGALRFWWRALNWKRAVDGRNEEASLQWLHREEARLFGEAADESNSQDNRGGQGVFLLSVKHGQLRTYAKGSDLLGNNGGIAYLMGQGLWHFRNKLNREAFEEAQEFTVSLAFKPKTNQDDIEGIVRAFCLFGLLGALGSRARHGFGSIAIKNIEANSIELPCAIHNITTKDGYIQILKQLIPDVQQVPEPPLSAFSANSVISVVCEKSTIKDVLAYIGSEMQLYRSYGRNGKVNGQNVEQNFKDDHDQVLNFSLTRPPKRTVFGLPHNYFFSSSNLKVDINAKYHGSEARRASPLLLHIHPVGNRFIAVHTLLQGLFLPNEARVEVKSSRKKPLLLKPEVDYGVIRTYLNHFQQAERIL